MDITILELKKKLREIEDDKSKLYFKMDEADVIKYATKEDRQFAMDAKQDLTMLDVLNHITDLNAKERKLKHALSYANMTTETSLGISIADALVQLAQNQRFVHEIETSIPRTRTKLSVGYQNQYTECLYDFDTIDGVLDKLKSEITQLQLAIDLANASTKVHLDD